MKARTLNNDISQAPGRASGAVEKTKSFLATPKGKTIAGIAAIATVGAAAMLIRRARRNH